MDYGLSDMTLEDLIICILTRCGVRRDTVVVTLGMLVTP